MPIIPIEDVKQSQILNAGSPVPIAGTGEARMQGEAASGFGQAMFQLGDALDRVARKAKDDSGKLQAQDLLNQFRMRTLEEKARADAAAPIEEDKTGFGQVKQFNSNLQTAMQDIAGTVTDPEVKKRFLIAAGDVVNDTAIQVLSNEVVKRTEQNKFLQGKVISDLGTLARANPSETPFMLDEVERSIRANTDIPGAKMEELVIAGKQGVLNDAIEGMLSRKEYLAAEKSLEGLSKGILTVDQKAKMLDNIRQTQYKDDSRELQATQLKDRMTQKNKERIEQQSLNEYSTALLNAGNDEFKRAPILTKLYKDMGAGVIDGSKGLALASNKFPQQVKDDYYDGTIMTKVIKGSLSIDKALNQVTSDRFKEVSPERSSDIINRLNMMKERYKNEPGRKQLEQD